MQNLQPLINSLQGFAQKKLNFERPPKLFFKQDAENAKDIFGKTAYYDPNQESITLFTLNRHPKDILRSFAHELVHHCQNLRGDLSQEKCGKMDTGYAQENDHMREMEREAYERGSLCFRDWEDGIKIRIAMQQENKMLKENKQMTVKINKQLLKGLITKILEEKESEEIISEKSKCALSADCGCQECEDKAKLEEEFLEEGEVPPGLKKYQDKKKGESAGKTSGNTPMSVSAADDSEEAKASSAEINNRPKTADEEDSEQIDERGGPQVSKCPSCGAPAKENKDGMQVCSVSGKPISYKGGKAVSTCTAKRKEANESNIQTPEQEKALYESRFTKKDTRLYEKLLKEWTK
jgi:hypothetical protein